MGKEISSRRGEKKILLLTTTTLSESTGDRVNRNYPPLLFLLVINEYEIIKERRENGEIKEKISM